MKNFLIAKSRRLRGTPYTSRIEEEGVTDFDQYAVDPESTLVSDFFVDDNPEDWIQA